MRRSAPSRVSAASHHSAAPRAHGGRLRARFGGSDRQLERADSLLGGIAELFVPGARVRFGFCGRLSGTFERARELLAFADRRGRTRFRISDGHSEICLHTVERLGAWL